MAATGTIILGVLSTGVLASAADAWFERRRSRQQTRWTLQREACVRALKVVDGLFANTTFVTDGVEGPNLKQDPPSIVEVRQSLSDLLVTCENGGVVVAYRRCLGLEGSLSASAIDDLRTAIREELGFGDSLAEDRSMSWIAYVSQVKEAQKSGASE